jgi:hypothetical protein
MGRTQADIDRVFEQLLREQEAAAARDRKAWEDSRKKEDPTILPLLPGAKDAKGGNP